MATVLIVEDDQYIREMYALILRKAGYEVAEAPDGSAGLVDAKQGGFDVILLDLMMPQMDGWQVYQQLKADAATAEIPVIVVTAKAQNIDKVLGLHIAKVDDYISKPFSLQELVDRVEKVLKRHEQAA